MSNSIQLNELCDTKNTHTHMHACTNTKGKILKLEHIYTHNQSQNLLSTNIIDDDEN